MGGAKDLHGHVVSIAAGTEDHERNDNPLANVNPTFTWARLAQRIPVRIGLDEVPPGTALVAGQTATVTVLPRDGSS